MAAGEGTENAIACRVKIDDENCDFFFIFTPLVLLARMHSV